jgi:hypothetical protein
VVFDELDGEERKEKREQEQEGYFMLKVFPNMYNFSMELG